MLEITVTSTGSQHRLMVPLAEIRSVSADDANLGGYLIIATDNKQHEIGFLATHDTEPKLVWAIYEKVRRAWSRWYMEAAVATDPPVVNSKMEAPRFREA